MWRKMTVTLQRSRGTSGAASAQDTFYIVATNPPYGTICRDCVRELPGAVRNHVRVSTFDGWRHIECSVARLEQSGSALLVSRLADIPEDAKALAAGGPQRRHLVFVEDMPVEAIPSRVSRLNVRDSRRLHIVMERNLPAISAIIKRAISGMAIIQDPSRIVDAWVEGANLVVLSPSFQRLYVPVTELARYLGNHPERIKAFEIDEDGSYLHWPHADVHLGWEQLQGIVDPTILVAAQRRSEAFNRKYGAAIRGLREDRGLKQSDIRGIADRHLRRIEHGQIAATSSVLRALAEAHAMSLADYLGELAERL
ncbi:MAG: DUF2442 domain-containing protein [Thermoguttaceae bacterium]